MEKIIQQVKKLVSPIIQVTPKQEQAVPMTHMAPLMIFTTDSYLTHKEEPLLPILQIYQGQKYTVLLPVSMNLQMKWLQTALKYPLLLAAHRLITC